MRRRVMQRSIAKALGLAIVLSALAPALEVASSGGSSGVALAEAAPAKKPASGRSSGEGGGGGGGGKIEQAGEEINSTVSSFGGSILFVVAGIAAFVAFFNRNVGAGLVIMALTFLVGGFFFGQEALKGLIESFWSFG